MDHEALDLAAATHNFSGVVTVDVGDRRALERCYGSAHRALGVPNTSTTRFAMASGSKTFTACAVMRLVERGPLALDEPARRYLQGDLPLIDDAVTIEQLLGHTSGIGDYLDENGDWEVDDYVLPVPVHTLTTAESFLAVVDGFPQQAPPGARFVYCNGGYIVLAIILERVTGKAFQQVVADEVLAPAGLTRTGYLRSDELPGDAAVGYIYTEGDRSNVFHLPVLGNGDGGAYTTASDLHLFWRALCRGDIVSSGTLAEMTRPRVDVPEEGLRYGLGMWLHPSDPAVVMEGYDAGVSFRSTHDPATATTVSVLGNTSEGAWPVIAHLEELWPELVPG